MSNEQQEIEYPDWLPKELEGALIHQNALLPILFPELGLNVNGQITPIFTDPRMEKAWAAMRKNNIDLVTAPREAERMVESWNENLNTKTMSVTEFDEWKRDVKRTANKLANLVVRTPYESILSDLGLKLTTTNLDGEVPLAEHLKKDTKDLTIYDLLLYVSVVNHENFDRPIDYRMVTPRKGRGDSIEKDFVIRLHQFFIAQCGRPLNHVTATLINSLKNYADGSQKKHLARDIADIVRAFKRAQKGVN